jgi:hypothetical protein
MLGALKRAVEWLWRGDALAAATSTPSGIAFRQAARARACAELGRGALANAEGAARGEAAAVAAGLYAEAIGRCLLYFDAQAASSGDAPPRAPDPHQLAELLDRHHGLVSEACEHDPDAQQRLRRRLASQTFSDVATPAAELRLASIELGNIARRLLHRAGDPTAATRKALSQRLQRSTFALLLMFAVTCGVFLGLDWYERKADLTRGKPWRTSSTLQQACVSPERSCPQRGYFFVHTYEEASPWLEFDLGTPQTFRSLRVFNRRDCCGERALPLLVEVSNDHVHWREVVRRDTIFTTWRASVSPTRARWVRFRVAHRSFLHLFDVRILP